MGFLTVRRTVWEFTKSFNSAQNQAERRREFYVALTRVEHHLIIVGNSTNSGTICSETGMLQFTSKPWENTMGHMWMEGLRSIAFKENLADSPWLKPDDLSAPNLGDYGRHEVSINPVELYFNSQLGRTVLHLWLFFTARIVSQNNNQYWLKKNGK